MIDSKENNKFDLAVKGLKVEEINMSYKVWTRKKVLFLLMNKIWLLFLQYWLLHF